MARVLSFYAPVTASLSAWSAYCGRCPFPIVASLKLEPFCRPWKLAGEIPSLEMEHNPACGEHVVMMQTALKAPIKDLVRDKNG